MAFYEGRNEHLIEMESSSHSRDWSTGFMVAQFPWGLSQTTTPIIHVTGNEAAVMASDNPLGTRKKGEKAVHVKGKGKVVQVKGKGDSEDQGQVQAQGQRRAGRGRGQGRGRVEAQSRVLPRGRDVHLAVRGSATRNSSGGVSTERNRIYSKAYRAKETELKKRPASGQEQARKKYKDDIRVQCRAAANAACKQL